MTLSVVIPSRRDVRTSRAIALLRAWTSRRKMEVEFIVCGELLPSQSLDEGVVVIPIVPALKGRCIRAGVMASGASAILVCDADLPVSDTELDSLVRAISDCDVAAALRKGRASRAALRHVASLAFKCLARILVGIPKTADPQCGVKLYRATVARDLFLVQEISGLAYEVEIMRRACDLGLRVAHVPVAWRSDSTTIVLWREAPRMLFDLLRYSFLRWTRPKPEAL